MLRTLRTLRTPCDMFDAVLTLLGVPIGAWNPTL